MRNWLKRIFINRNIFYLWSGQIISQAGDSVYQIGLLWLMLEVSGSKLATGLVAMSGYLPVLLFGLLSGALTDRFNRRSLMILADIARGLLVLTIPFLFYTGSISGFILAIITFGVAIFDTIFMPARDTAVALLAPENKLLQANSLIQTSWQFAVLLGPVLAAAVIPLFGVTHLFTFDAVTFFVSLMFILKITLPRAESAPQKRPNLTLTILRTELKSAVADVMAGLRYAAQNKVIWGLLIITAADNLFIMGPAIIGPPIFIREVLHLDAVMYAYGETAYAVGMIIGTVALNFYGKYFRNSHMLLWGIMLDGITFLPLLWVDTFWGMYLTIIAHAAVIPLIIVPRPTLIQTLVPKEMQGRIFSMISVAVYGLTAISVALTGIMAELMPISYVFGLISILATLCGVFGWLVKEFRDAP